MGNGTCHCHHVTELQVEVAAPEAARATTALRPEATTSQPATDPLQNDSWGHYRHGGGSGPGDGPGDHGGGAGDVPGGPHRNDGVPRDAQGQRSLPLKLTEPLGSVGYKDKPIFDLKLTEKDEYKYAGSKNGMTCKRNVENHLISVAPVLQDILEWTESAEHEKTTRDFICRATSVRLSREQVVIVNAAIWGFLSAAVSGTAETPLQRSGQAQRPRRLAAPDQLHLTRQESPH